VFKGVCWLHNPPARKEHMPGRLCCMSRESGVVDCSFSNPLQEIEKHTKAKELQRLQHLRFEEDKRGLLQAIGALRKSY
jgi:hypothetical protein